MKKQKCFIFIPVLCGLISLSSLKMDTVFAESTGMTETDRDGQLSSGTSDQADNSAKSGSVQAEKGSARTAAEFSEQRAALFNEKGLAGFFAFYGSSEAVRLCAGLDSKNPADPSSLQRLMLALDYIETANTLRAEEKLEPLKVSDRMMALAMQTAAASPSHDQKGTVPAGMRANFAWGQKPGAPMEEKPEALQTKNPFDAWYTLIKKMYADSEVISDAAAAPCFNLTDKEVQVSGFALADFPDSYGNVFVELFSSSLHGGEQAFSTDEYRQRLDRYLDWLDGKGEKPVHVPLYRLYNESSGEHFYTVDSYEASFLDDAGWNAENIAWTVSEDPKDVPVYRLYNSNAGDHHYTVDRNERDSLIEAGWKDEEIGWYAPAEKTETPVWREYNPNAQTGSHNFTVDRSEHDFLCANGWQDEGIAWYSFE